MTTQTHIPSRPQPSQVPGADDARFCGESTQTLVRLAALPDGGEAWGPLSQKIECFLRERFGRRGLPAGVEFHDFQNDLMVKVMTKIGTFHDRGSDSFWGWVFTIGDRLQSDAWNRYNRARALGLTGAGFDGDDETVPPLETAEDLGETPTQIVRYRELAKVEQQCLAQLPEVQRRIYQLRQGCGLTFAQIGREVGIDNDDTVRSHHFRARKQLGVMLGAMIDAEGQRRGL
jgi:RNA polymerase sigma factor (sigma-70 family)